MSEKWKVKARKFVLPSGNYMEAGCHHTEVASAACGGCYARLMMVLEEIEADPTDAAEVIDELRHALRAEGAAKKKRRAG